MVVESVSSLRSDELQASNPNGTIPTLISQPGQRAVFESQICIEYLDDIAQHTNPTGTVTSLVGQNAWQRADCRLSSDFVNKKLCSPYYDILVKRSAEERSAAFNGLLQSLREFSGSIKGPLFFGDELSMVDVMLLPHAYRYYVLEHYRGPDFAVPGAQSAPELAAYHLWMETMLSLPAVQPTLPDKGRYIEHVRKYADATARSKVANAVRSGRAAHEMK